MEENIISLLDQFCYIFLYRESDNVTGVWWYSIQWITLLPSNQDNQTIVKRGGSVYKSTSVHLNHKTQLKAVRGQVFVKMLDSLILHLQHHSCCGWIRLKSPHSALCCCQCVELSVVDFKNKSLIGPHGAPQNPVLLCSFYINQRSKVTLITSKTGKVMPELGWCSSFF